MKTTLFTLFIAFICNSIQAQSFNWAKQIRGDSSETIPLKIATDGSGNVYTAGYFTDTVDFDPGINVTNLVSNGEIDIFITKMNSAGNFIWARSIGGNGPDATQGMAVDASGNVYVTGAFSNVVDFDPGIANYNFTASGGIDMFVLKLDNSGNFVWAKQITGADDELGVGIAIDASDYVYTTGYFGDLADFDPGLATYNMKAIGYYDIFILKLNALGDFIWAKQFEGSVGSNYGIGKSITVDLAKNVYTSGEFSEDFDFDPGLPTNVFTTSGDLDVFISKLDSMGNFVWAQQIGGTDEDACNSLVLDASGNVHTSGYFGGTADFDPGAGTFNLSASGFQDLFVLKLNSAGALVWAKNIGGSGDEYNYGMALDASGNIYTTGSFEGNVDFDPGTATNNLQAVGNVDVYVSKLNSSGNFGWAVQFGGIPGGGTGSYAEGSSIAVDKSGNVFTTGYFEGTTDFDPGIKNFSFSTTGGMDGFITKLGQCQATSFTLPPVTSCKDYILNSQTYTTSGTYTQLLKNAAGCDSTLKITLTIQKPAHSIIASDCNSYTLNGQTYTTSGVYKQTVKNSKGCDSTITLTLTIKKTTGSITANACTSYTINTKTYTATGVYTQTLVNKAGCDSILTINLTISSKATTGLITPVACNQIVINSQTYTNTGVYTQTLKNKGGCDSTLTINLTINKSSAVTLPPVTACRFYKLNAQTYTTSGVYTQNLKSKGNCDSVITLNLTINTVNKTVTQTGATLQANLAGAAYKWLDCNTNKSPISGQVSQSFTATKNGSYAVEVTQNTCKDTSTCYAVTGLSVANTGFSKGITVYPNPTLGAIQIEMTTPLQNGTLKLITLSGQTVMENTNLNGSKFLLNLNEQARGIYFIEINQNGSVSRTKVVKY